MTTRSKPRRATGKRSPQPARSKTPFVVGIVLVVVVIAAIAAVLATRDDNDDPPGATPGTEVPAVTGSVPEATDGATATTNPLPDELVGEIRPITVDGSALPTLDNPDSDAAVGLAAPVLTGEGFDGSVVTTASDGGPVMIVVLAHWCPHCNAEIPRLIGLEEEDRFPADLKVVGVSTGVNPQRPNFPPSEWIVEKGWPWPVMADGVDFATGRFVGAEALGVSAFPFIVVVDADGNVRARWTGESEPDDFIAKLDAALAA